YCRGGNCLLTSLFIGLSQHYAPWDKSHPGTDRRSFLLPDRAAASSDSLLLGVAPTATPCFSIMRRRPATVRAPGGSAACSIPTDKLPARSARLPHCCAG